MILAQATASSVAQANVGVTTRDHVLVQTVFLSNISDRKFRVVSLRQHHLPEFLCVVP